MSLALLFWVLMIVWAIFGFLNVPPNSGVRGYGNTLLLFVLFAVLGWAVFGAAIHK